MNEYLKSGIVLLIILIASAGLLYAVYKYAEPFIEQNNIDKSNYAIDQLFPERDSLREEANYSVIYYNNEIIGYIVDSEAYGYSSYIEIKVGFEPDRTIRKVIILNQQETPGLGSKITEADFLSRFENKKPSPTDDIDGITGATISSNALKLAIKRAYEKLPQ